MRLDDDLMALCRSMSSFVIMATIKKYIKRYALRLFSTQQKEIFDEAHP
jgi:hypothetical protein